MTAFHKIEFRTNKPCPELNLIEAIKHRTERGVREKRERERENNREEGEDTKRCFSQLFSINYCANRISCFYVLVIEIGFINLEIW